MPSVIGAVDGRNGARDWIITQLTRRLNGTLQLRDQPVPKNCDILLSWRFKFIPDLKAAVEDGVCMIHLDLGYFDGTKLERFSVSINGVHGTSEDVQWSLDQPPRPHPEIKEWCDDGEFIQIIAPGWKQGKFKGIAIELPVSWPTTTAAAASKAFGKPAKIRPHPRNPDPSGPSAPGTLEGTFAETFCSVTYASVSAINTVCAGVPTVVFHPRCPAYEVAAHSYEIYKPASREAWIHQLSYREYHMVHPDELDKAAEFIIQGWEQCRRNDTLGGSKLVKELDDFMKGPVTRGESNDDDSS